MNISPLVAVQAQEIQVYVAAIDLAALAPGDQYVPHQETKAYDGHQTEQHGGIDEQVVL